MSAASAERDPLYVEVEHLRALLSEALDRLVASAPSYIDPGFRDLVARIEAVVNEEKA